MVFLPCIVVSETLSTPHFEIRYGSVGASYAGLIARSAERSFPVISEALGFRTDRPVIIELTSTPDEFRRLTGGVIPDWSAAVATGDGRIVMTPPAGQAQNIEHILAHEIVHIVIDNAAGDRFVPRWFHEGCAETYSGQWGVRDQLYMVWNTVRGRLLGFDDIERLFSARGADVSLAYDQSTLAVGRLMSLYGEDAPRRILDGLRRGSDFDASFADVAGITVGEFERRFRERLQAIYGRRALWTFIPGTWTIIMILTVVVYIVKRRRSKRLLSQWEIVETAENIIRFEPRPPDDYPE